MTGRVVWLRVRLRGQYVWRQVPVSESRWKRAQRMERVS